MTRLCNKKAIFIGELTGETWEGIECYLPITIVIERNSKNPLIDALRKKSGDFKDNIRFKGCIIFKNESLRLLEGNLK